LGLTFDHPTCRSFVARAKTATTMKEIVGCFRILASVFVGRYSQADTKTTKSAIVFNIVTKIRRMGGHFCRYEKGAWYEVGYRCARGKVSCYLRDMLHTQYRSSAKAKIIRRRSNETQETQDTQDTQIQHDGQQPVDGTVAGNSTEEEDSSTSSSCWENSLDLQGLESRSDGRRFL
jgi:hypothetical protein